MKFWGSSLSMKSGNFNQVSLSSASNTYSLVVIQGWRLFG